jgi:hypothetical protein
MDIYPIARSNRKRRLPRDAAGPTLPKNDATIQQQRNCNRTPGEPTRDGWFGFNALPDKEMRAFVRRRLAMLRLRSRDTISGGRPSRREARFGRPGALRRAGSTEERIMVAIGSIRVAWGMSREEVKGLLGRPTWGENEQALGYGRALDWGEGALREIIGGTFVIFFFDERGLARVQFPSGTVLGDPGTGRFFLELACEQLGAVHGPPAVKDLEALVLEWRTPAATITLRIEEEYDGPRERGTFGFHYHYDADHYAAPREPDRYLRVTYARPP